MMVGRGFLVLAGAYQFGHGVGGFTTNFIILFIQKHDETPSLGAAAFYVGG